jgi:hypothetical protein
MKSDYPTIEKFRDRNDRFKEIKTSEQLQREMNMEKGIRAEEKKNKPRLKN